MLADFALGEIRRDDRDAMTVVREQKGTLSRFLSLGFRGHFSDT